MRSTQKQNKESSLLRDRKLEMDNRAIKVSLQFLICTYISTINKTRGFYEIRCLWPKGCVFANRVKYGMWDMLKLLELPFALKTYFIPHHQLYEN